VHQQPVS